MDRDDNRIDILGYSKSRLEIFLSGVTFFLFHSFYEVLYVGIRLPENWKLKDFFEVEKPMFISLVMMSIYCFLIFFSIFGGDGRLERLKNRYGTFGTILRMIIIGLMIIVLSSVTPFLLIITFF